MIKWWRHKVYYGDVMAQIMMTTLRIGDHGKMLQKHRGIRDAIRMNFHEGTPPMVAATHISAALMSYAIELDDDVVRKQIVEQLLAEWSILGPNEQREISRQLGAGPAHPSVSPRIVRVALCALAKRRADTGSGGPNSQKTKDIRGLRSPL